VNQNPSGKITQKLEIKMPITFVDWNHNDKGSVASPILAKAALLCYHLMVKSR